MEDRMLESDRPGSIFKINVSTPGRFAYGVNFGTLELTETNLQFNYALWENKGGKTAKNFDLPLDQIAPARVVPKNMAHFFCGGISERLQITLADGRSWPFVTVTPGMYADRINEAIEAYRARGAAPAAPEQAADNVVPLPPVARGPVEQPGTAAGDVADAA